MDNPGTVVIVGGTSEIGKQLGMYYHDRGYVVAMTSRDAKRAQAVAKELGANAYGLALDLADPHSIADALADVEDVIYIALVAVDRDENKVREYDIDGAIMLVTLKMVGYTEVIHQLVSRMRPYGSILLYGGLAKERPYIGSTTVTTVNGGVSSMVRTLALELAPIRVNAIHPAVVGDSPYWANKPKAVLDRLRERTPGGELITIAAVTDAAVFLLENPAVNGINLNVDGGWLLT